MTRTHKPTLRVGTLLAGLLWACGGGGGGGSGGGPSLSPPAAPSVRTPVAGGGQCIVSWDAVAGATRYDVYSATTPGVAVGGGTWVGGSAARLLQRGGLANGTTHHFVVTASNAAGASPASAEVDCTPAPVPIARVAAGASTSYALGTDGRVWAFGSNAGAGLGGGAADERRALPAPVCAPGEAYPCATFLTSVVDVQAGRDRAVALRGDGTVWVWGWDGGMGSGGAPVQVCAAGQSAPCTSFLANVTAIAAGDAHALALDADGAVWAWGTNSVGQLGNGTVIDAPAPVRVCASGATAPCATFLSHVTGIAAARSGEGGAWHSIAVRDDGTVWTWGGNLYGQLGAATAQTCSASLVPCSTTPLQVTGLSSVTAVAAGGTHSLALRSDRTVWAWGSNHHGLLGDGTGVNRASPIQVCAAWQVSPCASFLADVRALSAGPAHTLAVAGDGTVWAWGSASLGDGTSAARWSPVAVTSLTAPAAIAAGWSHSLALRTGGTVVSWGANSSGELGVERTYRRLVPGAVAGISDAVAVSAGGAHVAVLRQGGTVAQWGNLNDRHAGYGAAAAVATPVPLGGVTGATALGGGTNHVTALAAGGAVWIWGANVSGVLGQASPNASYSAVRVCAAGQTSPCAQFLTGVAALAESGAHALAVQGDSTAWSWGWNGTGQLGDGTTGDRSTPVAVCDAGGTAPCATHLSGVATLAGGMRHTLAVKSDRSVWAWGENAAGQLGDGTTAGRPVPGRVCARAGAGSCAEALADVARAAAGDAHSVAVKTDGTVWAWGQNGHGQLGDGTASSRATPVRVLGLSNVGRVACGSAHTVALGTDGTVWAWGANDAGQLGDGTTTDRATPAQVPGLSSIVAVGAGAAHGAAVRDDGAVFTWGDNATGQLGDGTTLLRLAPGPVSGL